MAGVKGQGKIQKLILAALDTNPVLALPSLNPDSNRSRQRSLRRAERRLLAGGLLVRLKVVVPSPSGPLIYDVVAKSGAAVLGIPTVSQNDLEPKPEPVPEPEIDEREEPMTLNERIERLQEKINS
jgi:hypothetical protein